MVKTEVSEWINNKQKTLILGYLIKIDQKTKGPVV